MIPFGVFIVNWVKMFNKSKGKQLSRSPINNFAVFLPFPEMALKLNKSDESLISA